MAYSDPGDAVPGAVITAAWGDAVRANVNECALARFAAKGDLAVATAANVVARLAVGADHRALVAASGEATGVLWQAQPMCRVYNSIAIDPAAAAWVTLTFDSERFDPDAMHNPALNPSRITIPAGNGGVYAIGGNVKLETSITGVGEAAGGIRILLNNATVIAEDYAVRSRSTDLGGVDTTMHIDTIYQIPAGEFVELQVWTSLDCDVLAVGNYSPVFWAHWVRSYT